MYLLANVADYLNILAIMVVFMPLVMSGVSGYFSCSIPVVLANVLTCGGLLISACGSWILAYYILGGDLVLNIHLLKWFSFDTFAASWALYIDSLTAVMIVVVTFVSCLVHLYSIGYMHHDPSRQRFMSYLSLFTFAMLMLVTANNFIQLFFGWEGVGLCSYLLIGFWYKKSSANAAAIKAFVVNRVGDIGLALGIFMIYLTFGSVEYSVVFAQAADFAVEKVVFLGYEWEIITIICILLFVGCMGKSAQIGLHTWLPDAMEGPTPVSALIHAATMVTAGVFLVARCSPLFELSIVALDMVVLIGAITSIFAASIAMVQNDIKKIIAYSTCSQLGYMFFACGASAYSSAIFHLATHACFKALLFLGAGSVIHALLDEQDIRKMGGIWKKIPATYVLFWIGSLALAGVFPFAGFYSKDAILEYTYASGGRYAYFAYYIGIIVAFMTAFYSWRLLFKVFHGKCNIESKKVAKIHDSPPTMMLPLILLAVASLISGWWLHSLDIEMYSSAFWGGALTVLPEHDKISAVHHLPYFVDKLPGIVGIVGIVLAYLLYILMPKLQNWIAVRLLLLCHLLEKKYYFDLLYDGIVVGFVKSMSVLLWKGADQKLIDNLPNGSASAARFGGRIISKMQSGYFYHYAAVMIMAVFVLLLWVVVVK